MEIRRLEEQGMTRNVLVQRNTKETKITMSLNLDGTGKASLNTGIGFFDHMLDGFARHGFFDLDLAVDGDLNVDSHHTIEDTGIVLGQAIAEALGDKTGIKRYGFYCNILLICLFAFQGQCLAVFRSITFAGLQQIVTLLNNLQTVVPHSHHFIGCMEKHGSRHLVYRRFVTQCDNLAIGSPTATVERIMEPNALIHLSGSSILFKNTATPSQRHIQRCVTKICNNRTYKSSA